MKTITLHIIISKDIICIEFFIINNQIIIINQFWIKVFRACHCYSSESIFEVLLRFLITIVEDYRK